MVQPQTYSLNLHFTRLQTFCIDRVQEDRARIPTQLTRHSNIFNRVISCSLDETTPPNNPLSLLLPLLLSQALNSPFSSLSSLVTFCFSLLIFFSFPYLSFPFFPFFSFLSFLFLFFFSFLSLSLSFFSLPLFSVFSRRPRNFTDNILTGWGGVSHPPTPPLWRRPWVRGRREGHTCR